MYWTCLRPLGSFIWPAAGKRSLPLLKALTLALGLLFIFFTAANCANGVHSPLIPSLVGLALSSAASCLALTGAPEGRGDE